MKNFNLIEMLQGCSKRNGTTFRQSNPDGQPTVNRQSRLMSRQGWFRNLAMIFAVLVLSMANIGMAWGAYDVPANGKVTLSTKVNNSGRFNVEASGVYHFRLSGGYSWSDGNGIKTQSNQCGVIFYLDASTEIEVGIKHTESKNAHDVTVHVYSIPESEYKQFDDNKAGAAESNRTFSTGPSTSSDDSFTISVAATSSTFTGTKTLAAGYYAVVPVGSKGNTYFNSIKFTSGGGSTKRIYMKAGAWNNDSPKFFVHSWGSSDSDVQLTALGGCETDVFYADIPSGNTSLIFTRQKSSTSSIIWEGDDLWNRTDNISISTYDLFTFATWDGGPSSRSTFTGGTYSPTTYTITYAANGGGGSMTATSGICPDANQAITSNAFTAPSGCASFAYWTANVAVKVGGAMVAAGNPIANEATIQDINSNIILTAVWKLATPTITDNNNNTFSISGSIGGASYYYTIDGSTPTTSSSSYSSAVGFDADITTKAIAHKDGYVDSDVASQACSYHVCSISECGNATLTYVINVGTSGSNASDRSDLITSATASNTTALGVSNSAGGNLTLSDNRNSAATTNACYPSKPAMTSKISVHNGESYSSSDYLQFAFTVKDGYTFTPCDIQFVVQPVSNPVSFRWEVTDGTSVYGYGTANNVPKGSSGGASVLTGITSPSAMEAGTYYIRLYPFYNGSNTFRLGTDVILKGTTAAAACVAPTAVNITGTYHYFPGATISLNAAAEGGSGTPTTYQWYKGGTADGNIIEGATSATYSKAKCTYADAGSYYCKVTRGGSCSKFSGNYDVKILHLYVKTGRNGSDYGDVDFTKVDGSTATASISLGSNWDYGFNIADGCGHYYGNSGKMTEDNCTDWSMDVDGTDCLMRTTNGATYTFTVDYTTLTAPVVSITYPSANQAADKVIYFDNSARNWSTLHYRIGRTNHTQATAMTQVPGTANLYKVNTAAYDNFSGWHIANNAGWTGDNNSIYRTNTNNDQYSITYATAHEGGAVTDAAITVTPMTSRGMGGDKDLNDNCEFYNYEITTGMKTQNVSITAPSNGTIRVAYTDVAGESQSFTSGNRDLAHTVIITPTATPAEGYTLSGLTVNGDAHTSGTTYTVTANTTIAATFSPASYTVTLNTNDGTINAGNVTSYTYGTGATLPTNVTKSGFTFDGWYDNSGLTGDAVTTIANDATGDKAYWAKWTEKQTTITINANTANHGSTTPGTVTATYGSALPSFTAASGASGWSLTGYWTAETGGNKIINADGTLVASTSYADGSGNWNSEVATLTLYAQYEEDGCSPTTASITFNNNVAGKFNTNWSASDITTSGGATYTLTNTSCDTGHKMTKQAIKGAKNTTLIQINIPAGATSGTISVSAATYDGGAATVAITNSSGTVLASKGLSSTTTNAGSDSWSAPTLKTASYNITAGGTYYIKETSNSNNIYIYAFSATAEVPCDETAPTFVSSVPANGATGVATSGTIVLTFSEALGSVDASKFTLTGASKGAVAIDGSDATKVNITYSGAANSATVTLATDAAAVSDLAGNALASALSNISFTTAAAAPATKDIYYGAITITAGALTKGSTGTSQFFTNIGGTIANNTEISWSSGPGTGGEYYESNVLTDTELSKSGNWNTSSGSNRYVGGMKFQSGSTYTLALGSKVASSITFYGRNGSASKTMTVGGEDWTSSATKNTFAKHEFIKTGGFTGDVSITQDGDFYGILVITIQTATPCTTPVIPTLSNQSLCEGADIAAWDATVTNASAISAAGETVNYSWKKKGNATELANEESFDLGASAAESQGGTYVVTVTVSKAGKASATATKEVTLSVTEGIEVTGITADKATVYPTNSVTLTATASADATWQWYTCSNAEGASESRIDDATSASYTIASAGSAGTYYYKVKATGSCGTDEMVYTLTVSAAAGGDCETYYFFANAGDATTNGVTQNADDFFSGAKAGTNNNSTNITVDGNKLTITKRNSAAAHSVVFTVPTGATASLYTNAKANSNTNKLTITRSSDSESMVVTDQTALANYTLSDIPEGTWTLTCGSGNNWYYGAIIVKVCSGTSCTDPEVTANVNNSTACVGSSVTFTATGAHASATYQWQKLDGTWTNISGATASTYNIPSVVAGDAGKYRVIASYACNRTSNEVTLSVPSAPNFGSTVPASVSVMQTIALSINTVEATDATKYRWYKSADDTWDAGDTEIGTNKELIKAYDSEAIGSPSYYIFCRAQNACGITTSSAIAVNVTAYVEEDCATRGNEGDAEFGFEYSAGQATYNSTACWSMNDNSKKLIYAAPDGKYFKTMKVTIASSKANKASYRWSTNGGTSYTEVAINSINTTLMEKTIDVSTHGNVNALQIGRNLDGKGESSGTLYVSKICFEYTDACTATTVTPSTSSVNYEMGGEWSNPTFTLSVVGTLTYSSSNEDIASVDDDGTVTFNGEAGTVTITASYAGNATDCASEGSYTINVSCPGGAPKVVASGTTVGCNSSITLQAKQSDETSDFADGTYQWFRNGEEIDGETSSSYTATQAGTYTVSRTKDGCTSPSSNSAVVTSETTEPEVERLVPFQYYHVDKEDYSDQMKMRHLFAVKNSGKLDGKSFKMYVSRNGGAATDVTSSNALVVWPNGDGHVDTVMVDLNKLSGKYSVNDELVFTCKAIDCDGNVSNVYKNTITMRVIGATPTLALICSGSNKASGTRKTSELTVGGDFLTGYNVADLCQQTGNTSFDANTEWGLYTRLKENYIVTPVNGYAVFNKLNYEPFDILLLTDYPKASKSDAAAAVLDDMADLCDYRPMLSFKAHMVAKSPSKWAAKGFTTSPVVPKNTRTRLNIVCYAHPMFADMKETATHIQMDNDDRSQIVYTMLTGAGFEGSKGLQGFELEAAENFVTIGLTHYNATPADGDPSEGFVTWTPGAGDRMLVTAVERQKNIEARMIMFAVNCGAQSKFTETGRNVVLKCLEYLLDDNPLHVADCSFTFDNGANAPHDAEWYKVTANCPGCTGTLGDGKWSTAANWAPDRLTPPGKDTEVKIAASVEVDMTHAIARSARIVEGGHITIPAGKALEIVGTIRRLDGTEISPTEENDIHIGSSETGNGTLIFNNNSGDTKAQVDMYSNALADVENMSAATSTWQYIGTPHSDVANARSNYYDSWLYQYSGSGWEVIPNGGPLVPFRGYCVTHPDAPVVFSMEGTLAATTSQDIAIPAGYTVIANSWVAPIDINAITDDDMEGISDKSIYFFNTGTDAEGNHGTGTEAGTYRAAPIHSASYTGDWQIPSMQGFYVSTTSAGTLHLDYDRHVRPTGSRSVVSNPMYAPRRAAAESDEPNVLKIFARGSRYQDKLVVLEREDFTRGYDSGWDGEAWGGGTLSPMVYVTGEGREDAVSAIPEFEGTVIAFKAGEDNEYTIDFEYNSEEPLYLLDTENNTYTQVITGNAYYFTTTDKAAHSRFILTRKAPQIATGTELTSDGEGAKARKLLIEDKMYILLNGMLYDATGKVVK